MINEEGGVDPEEFRVEAVIDRVNTYSSVWLGSTIACARNTTIISMTRSAARLLQPVRVLQSG